MDRRMPAAGVARVLIVDDNVALAENVAEFLELEGYRTEIAACAEDALPLALAGDLAILVTEFRLPGMNGAELVAQLRRARDGLHCIVISAYTDDRTVSTARAAGARFLAKPLNLRDLARAVSDAEGSA